MAKITSWSGNSPHAREVAALERLKAELPAHWFGYANVFVKDPRKDAGQEVDLILVCDDRILMIDVKDWIGTVTQGRGFWYQAKPGRSRKLPPHDCHRIYRVDSAIWQFKVRRAASDHRRHDRHRWQVDNGAQPGMCSLPSSQV